MIRSRSRPLPARRRSRGPFLLLVGLTWACGGDRAERPAGDGPSEPSPPTALTEGQRAAAVERGEAAAGRLREALGTTLQERIAAEGLPGAVAFCDLEALPLTARVTEELGVEVGRTAPTVRNPANRPDGVDRAALARFEGTAAGDVPYHLESIGDSTVRFYAPLYTLPLCVGCHGPAATLDAELASILRERYPDDEATGYSVGDFRGVIRVTMRRAELGEESGGS